MEDISSHHKFFDRSYVEKWAETVTKRPERKDFFDAFAQQAKNLGSSEITVLEIGAGPGFLAEQLLKRCCIASYYLFDFSSHMHDLSRDRLGSFKVKTVFLEGDFSKDKWGEVVPSKVDLVVSLQSVHEVRHSSKIPRLYKEIFDLLIPGGLFLLCDHMNKRRKVGNHFMTPEEHVETLKEVGFVEAHKVLTKADMSLLYGRRPV